jgi:hypothetical protein
MSLSTLDVAPVERQDRRFLSGESGLQSRNNRRVDSQLGAHSPIKPASMVGQGEGEAEDLIKFMTIRGEEAGHAGAGRI